MNRYRKYLIDNEALKYILLAIDREDKNIWINYLKERKRKENKWIYYKLSESLRLLKEQKKKQAGVLLNQLEIIKQMKINKEKNISSNINIYYLNLEEAKFLSLEYEWYDALRKSLMYCYSNIETPKGNKINIYDLVAESEGFNNDDIIPALYILFCNEYKDIPYGKIVKDLKKKIKKRKAL